MVGAECFPSHLHQFLVSAEQGPAPGLRGGGIHLVRPGRRKSIFLEKERLRKEWFPPGQRETSIPSEAPKSPPPLPYSTLVSFWASSVGIRKQWRSHSGARHPMSSSVSLASSCQKGRPRASPNRDSLKLGLALKH